MQARRIVRSASAGALLVAAVLVVSLVVPGAAHAASSTATCVSPLSNATATANMPQPPIYTRDIEWRATFEIGPAPDELLKITNLELNYGSGWKQETSWTWELKWGLRDKPDGTRTWMKAEQLKGLSVNSKLSPKLISPDGGCAILLRPGLGGQPSWPTVGIVGDSLTQNTFWVWAPPLTKVYSQTGYDFLNLVYPHGRIQQQLNGINLRAETESWGGRTLANWSDPAVPAGNTWPNPKAKDAQLVKADGTMLDELRGMVKHSTKALVVALGANDASAALAYINAGTSDFEKYLRLLVAEATLVRALAEVSSANTCVVLVSPPTGYPFGLVPWHDLATRIGDIYRESVNGQRAKDGVRATNLRMVEFGRESSVHHDGADQNDPNNWFQADDLHFNEAGADAYAKLIKAGVQSC